MEAQTCLDKKNICNDTIWVALCDHSLNISVSCSTRPQTMGDSGQKQSEVREVGVDVNGVEILEYSSFVNGARRAVETSGLVSV